MPTRWYNVVPDLPAPPPPPLLHPGTHAACHRRRFCAAVPQGIDRPGNVLQERYIDIPGEVLDVYRLWRPSPLLRSSQTRERLLGTPAKIFYKYEGVSPAGSHKPNTAVPQVWYNAQEGITKLTTETGRWPVG